ncbi:MAG TPA: glycosyltransferase [Acidimicrobiales bacterium]|nr:glycosyltransferase [Acidimicrobiales bacterium]
MSIRPAVSVVLESVNAGVEGRRSELATALRPVLAGLSRQTEQDFETVLVVGAGGSLRGALPGDWPPRTRVVAIDSDNYFAAKNEGARRASGDLVLFLDSDTVPAPHWLASMVTAFRPGVQVVAGRTRYAGESLTSRALSHMILAVTTGPNGDATGFVANNVGFRREVFLSRLFDERIPRHGGCYLLYHQLRREGVRVVYAPEAEVRHRLDTRYLSRQYERGLDAVLVHRLDEEGALSGTGWRMNHPWAAPIALSLRRIAYDFAALSRSSSRAPMRGRDVPAAAAVITAGRLAALAGELAGTVRPARRASAPPR